MRNFEQPLKARDLMYFVFRSWRRILVYTIVCVIALSVITIILVGRNKGNGTNDQISQVSLSEKEIKAIRKEVLSKDSDAQEIEKQRKSLQKELTGLENLLETSIYLSLDANAQPISRFDLIVELETSENDSNELVGIRNRQIIKQYLNYCKSGDFINYLVATVEDDISAKQMRELVSVSLDDSVIRIEITGPDLDVVGLLSGAAQDYLTGEKRDDTLFMYPHTTKVINYWMGTEINPDIRDLRLQTVREIRELKKDIEGEEDAIEAIVESSIEERIMELEAELADDYSVLTTKSFSVTMAGLGGLIIGVLIVIFQEIRGRSSFGLIRDPEDWAEQQKMLLISSTLVPAQDIQLKKFGSRLDKWLEDIFIKKEILPGQNGHSLRYCASLIHGLVKNSMGDRMGDASFHRILCIGDIVSPVDQYFVQGLSDELLEIAGVDDKKLRIELVSPSSTEGIMILQSSDFCIFLVKSYKTKVRDFKHSEELVKTLGIEILGIVEVGSQPSSQPFVKNIG